jgi:hypothetical protein
MPISAMRNTRVRAMRAPDIAAMKGTPAGDANALRSFVTSLLVRASSSP